MKKAIYLGVVIATCLCMRAEAVLIVAPLKDNSGAAYPAGAFGPVNSTDLANQAQPTFLSSSQASFGGGDTAALLNDGLVGDANGSDAGSEAQISSASSFTYNFNISTNVAGYDIVSLASIAGHNTASNGRSNQGYRVSATFIDNSTSVIVPKATFEPNSPAELWTKVSLSDTTGRLATGVKSLTFDQFDNANAGGVAVYHEVDVLGSASLIVGQAQINAGDVLPSPVIAVAGDLLETSVALATGENAGAKPRNGTTGTAAENSGTNPAVVWGGAGTTTYDLDVSTNTLGYDITAINVFSGWNDRAAQSYRIFYSLVGSGSFTQLGGDITAGGGTQSSVLTRTYDPDGTAFLSGVDAIRFVQFDGPAALDGTNTVFREFDVIGFATVPEPSTFAMLLFSGAFLWFIRGHRT